MPMGQAAGAGKEKGPACGGPSSAFWKAPCYCGQLSRLVSPWPGGPVWVPLGLTPFVFFGPHPGLYCEFEALPLPLPLPPPAMTPPVPAAISATVSTAARLRDFTWNPFGREVAAFAIALVLILSRSSGLAVMRSVRSRSATSRSSSGRISSFGLIDALYEPRMRFLTAISSWRKGTCRCAAAALALAAAAALAPSPAVAATANARAGAAEGPP